MRCVVDTNVIAYRLLKSEAHADELVRFFNRATVTYAPDLWKAELLNVMWQAVRSGALTESSARELLRLAQGLVSATVPIDALQSSALHLALKNDHPAYDTAFVALALAENVPLATYDKRLQARFPDVAMPPSEIVLRSGVE